MSATAAEPLSARPDSFRVMDPRRVGYFVRIIAIGVLAASFFAQDPIAYLFVAVPVLIPAFIWAANGAFGIPALPVVAALFYLYYAVPMLLGSTLQVYRTDELLWAGLSVGLFLLAAAIGAWPFMVRARHKATAAEPLKHLQRMQAIKTRSLGNIASTDELYRLVFTGLTAGNLYYLALLCGGASYVGTYLGVIRAISVTLASVACYLLGYARGADALRGSRWIVGLCGFLCLAVLSISNLMLVGGAINICAALLGYVLASKRMPWVVLGVAFAAMSVLNAGKHAVRDAYWSPDSQVVQDASVMGVPGMMANWLVHGVSHSLSLESPSRVSKDVGILERTSLLHMVLAVQVATPSVIPYLNGETYALLPAMMVPRFIDPRKIESQAALNLLSVRYGREAEDTSYKTTIGWGVVSEAYANFGNFGVLAMGLLFGALCGALTRLSARASAVSVVTLVAIGCTLTLCNLEMDFASLFMSLMQTVMGIFLFALLPRSVKTRPAPNVALRRPPGALPAE
jgi:hypothetical protein